MPGGARTPKTIYTPMDKKTKALPKVMETEAREQTNSGGSTVNGVWNYVVGERASASKCEQVRASARVRKSLVRECHCHSARVVS